MKLVLDTNVFVSGIFFIGPPFHILQAWRIGKVQLVVSPEILEEYRRVGEILAEEHPAINIEPVLEYTIKNATIFSLPGFPSGFVMIQMTTNSLLALWQVEVPLSLAAISISSQNQVIEKLSPEATFSIGTFRDDFG